jgi:GT2 family glycosyltransferase
VTGCCLLIRRTCWQELGGLDASFFLYYEDVDLCRRARTLGWSVWYEPRICAIHYNPLHQRGVPPAMRLITRHALMTYAARHWPSWQLGLLSGIVWIEAWMRRMWARWHGDCRSARIFKYMGHIARALGAADGKEARFRLERIVRLGDPRRGF